MKSGRRIVALLLCLTMIYSTVSALAAPRQPFFGRPAFGGGEQPAAAPAVTPAPTPAPAAEAPAQPTAEKKDMSKPASGCKHAHIEEEYVYENATYKPIDEKYHRVRGDKYLLKTCDDCGETLSYKLVKKNVNEKVYHRYHRGSDVCYDCLYDPNMVIEAESEDVSVESADAYHRMFGPTREEKTPEEPKEPEQPENPENPEQPENPENPEQPENPENPEQPENPENPEQPENPENPEQPENPETPENPENPEQPENPETPEQPVTPDKPVSPFRPQRPPVPETPAVIPPPQLPPYYVLPTPTPTKAPKKWVWTNTNANWMHRLYLDDMPTLLETLDLLGESCDTLRDYGVRVTIENMNRFLTAGERHAFSKLETAEQLYLATAAAGHVDALEGAGFTEDGLRLLENLRDNARKHTALRQKYFPIKNVKVDGVKYHCFMLELAIRDSETTRERYTFADMGDNWYLVKIQLGEYR